MKGYRDDRSSTAQLGSIRALLDTPHLRLANTAVRSGTSSTLYGSPNPVDSQSCGLTRNSTPTDHCPSSFLTAWPRSHRNSDSASTKPLSHTPPASSRLPRRSALYCSESTADRRLSA